MGEGSRRSATPAVGHLVGTADAFESRGFSSEELAAIKKTRRRSPRLGEATAEVQTLGAPPSLVDRIRERATSDGTTESQVIRHALEAYLSQG